MNESMRLALYQCDPISADVEGSLAAIERAAVQARAGGAAVLICPEMMLTGYNLSAMQVATLAESADGAAAARVARIAADNHIAIVYGYPERSGATIYNAAQLIDSTGRRRLNYRKTHLFGAQERKVFTAGTRLDEITDLDGWAVGLLICYDVEFPECTRVLALAGADLIVVPTALMQPYEPLPGIVMPARAYENQLYLVYANYCGDEGDLEYCGHSAIAAPTGECLALGGLDAEMLFADADKRELEKSRRLNTYMSDRVPALYTHLTRPASDR